MRSRRFELRRRRGIRREEPLREPHATGLQARSEAHAARPADEKLGRAAADVDQQRLDDERAAGGDTVEGRLRLVLAGKQPGRPAVARRETSEERRAVRGVTYGARRDSQHLLRSELGGLARIAVEHRMDAFDRRPEQRATLVDAFAEPRDREPTDDLGDATVADVGNEQACRVGTEVDRCDAHAAEDQMPGMNQNVRRIWPCASRIAASCTSSRARDVASRPVAPRSRSAASAAFASCRSICCVATLIRSISDVNFALVRFARR